MLAKRLQVGSVTLVVISCLIHLTFGSTFQFRFLHAAPGMESVSVRVNEETQIATGIGFGALSDYVSVNAPPPMFCGLDGSWCLFTFSVGCGSNPSWSKYTGLIIKTINATADQYHTISMIGKGGVQDASGQSWVDLKSYGSDIQKIAPSYLNHTAGHANVVNLAYGPSIDIAVNGVILVKGLNTFEQSSMTVTAGTYRIDILNSNTGKLIREFSYTVLPMTYHSIFGFGMMETVFPIDAVFSIDFSFAGLRLVNLNPFNQTSLNVGISHPVPFNWTTNLPFNATASPYLLLPYSPFRSNLYSLSITNSNGGLVGKLEVPLAMGATFSVFVMANATNNNIPFLNYTKDSDGIPTFLQSKLRVVHASPNTGPLSILLNFTNFFTNLTTSIPFNNAYGVISNYSTFGVYNQSIITITVSNGAIQYTTTFKILEQASYTLVIKGFNGPLGLVASLIPDQEVAVVSMGGARFMNAVVGAPALNVLLNNLTSYVQILFGKYTPYLPLRSGFYNISDFTGLLPSGNFFVPGNGNASLVAAGLWGNSTFYPPSWFGLLDNSTIFNQLSKFRLINLVPSDTGAQFYVNGQLVYSNQIYGPYTGYSMVPSANYTVTIKHSNSTIQFDHHFRSSVVQTFCLVGPSSSPSSVIMTEEGDKEDENENENTQTSDDLGTGVIITIIVVGGLGGFLALGLVVFIFRKRRQNPYFDYTD